MEFKKLLSFFWFLLSFFLSQHLTAQDAVPFTRGINLTGWFQKSGVQQIQISRYTKQDFEQIKSLGCDVIRLPINLHYMTYGGPNYVVNPLFFEFLDQVVDYCEELGLYLILDNHTFSPSENTDPNIGQVLEKVWRQVAQYYQNRSGYLMYEVLNEPHGITDKQWNDIQKGVIAAIRSVDTKHTIVIGPAGWNSFNNLAAMPVYDDDNLIYTFHFYDPFLFTHQGASWVNPSMVPLSGVPFPYSAGSMPALPVELKGSWIESSYNAYANTGTVSSVKQQLDIAIRFKNERKVPVFCGEFGVHIPNSDPADRVFWYETVRTYLEANNIPWTIWDYHGGFGLFEKDSNGLFDHDLNISLLTALGLNTPPQTPYVKVPDSTGFLIYTDFLDQQLYEGSYGDGKIDFYSANQPNNGKNCISWTGASRYNNLGLYFRPVKDLSWLAANGYALDFMIRGDKPGFKFDVRFVDTKTGVAGDLPWRNRITIDETLVPMDGRWYHLHVPLSSFTEHGAWDQQWYEPVGEFDWREINLLELATEHADLGHGKLWFDNIHITNLDTAQVYMTDQITAVAEEKTEGRFEMYPNPVQGQLHIAGLPPGEFSCKISDGLGRVWVQKSFRDYLEVDVGGLPRGIYYVKVAGVGKVSGVMKLVKE